MKTRKVGKITLALSLIALGILLLVSNFIELDVMKLLSIYWPSVIIIFGMELIVSKFIVDRKEDNTKVGIDGISFTVLLVIVFISLFITGVNRIATNIEIFPDIITQYKYETDFDKSFTIDGEGKDGILIENTFGEVEINTHEENTIKVSAEISIKHNDMELAENIVEDIIDINEDYGSKVYIKSEHYRFLQDRSKIKEIRVKYLVTVPQRFDADIINAFGPVTVDGIQEKVAITNKHGDVSAKNIGNGIKIENGFGRVEISDIKGNKEVIIVNQHGDVTAKNIECDIKIDNGHGKVDIFNVKGHAEVRNKFQRVKAIEVDNGLDIFNPQGEVYIQAIKGDINIENSHDEVSINKGEGNVKVNSEFSEVSIENIDGNVEVRTTHDDITIENVTGNVLAHNSFNNIEVKEANKRVELKNRHGDILFETSKIVEGDITIDNDQGDITIDIPNGQQGQFQIFTEYGQIKDNFGFAIKEEGNKESIIQKIGEKNVYFYLTTRHGDITVKSN